MKTLLVLGGSGLVGSCFLKRAISSYKVIATYNTKKIDGLDSEFIRFTAEKDWESLKSRLLEEDVDAVVHTIAYSNVDFCEMNKDKAHFLHVDFTEEVSEACEKIDAKLIYISSDYVFDGKRKHYTEEDDLNPLSYYGLTKLLAEKAVLEKGKTNAVLRPSVIYGWHPNSRFLHLVINNLRSGKEVETYTDQYSRPTLVDDLVSSILQVVEQDIGGIYHTVGSSCASRFEFANLIAEEFGLDKSLIKPVKSTDKPQIAKRPAFSCIDNTKATRELGIRFSTLEEGLKKVVEQSRMT